MIVFDNTASDLKKYPLATSAERGFLPFLIKEYTSAKIITGYIFYGLAQWSEPRSQKQFFLLFHKMR
jgi:hypothetical protein